MSDTLVSVQDDAEIMLQETITETRNYLENAKSESTRRAYRSDWKDFSTWCVINRLQDLPANPETVCLYVSHLARRCKVATIGRRLASISQAHQAAKLETPTGSAVVRSTMQGIRRLKGTAQIMKAPVVPDLLRRMLQDLPETLIARRDRALLLLGFAGAFRRSELVSLDREDVTFTERGVEVLLRRSKTDQEGEGTKIAILFGSRLETCPVRSLRTWIEAAAPSGPLFSSINRHGRPGGRLSGHTVAEVVKKHAAAAGLDPADFSGHSLRAGLATAAAMAGVPERVIQKQTRHKGVMMLRKYIREGDLWRENAAAEVGL